MRLADLALGLIVVAIWGVNFTVIKIGVAEIPPLTLTALRFAAVVFPAVLIIPRPKVAWRLLAAYGFVLGVVKFGLLFVALKIGMAAGLSSLVLQMQAFFTIALAVIVNGERPTLAQWFGACCALAGLSVITVGLGQSLDLAPFVMTLAAALCWGIANLLLKRAGSVNMLGFVVWSSLFAPAPLLALAWLSGEWATWPSGLSALTWRAAFAVGYLAYPTTLIGFAVWGHLLQRYPTATVAPLTLLVPLFGMTAGVLVLGEEIKAATLVGAGLIIAGLALNVQASQNSAAPIQENK